MLVRRILGKDRTCTVVAIVRAGLSLDRSRILIKNRVVSSVLNQCLLLTTLLRSRIAIRNLNIGIILHLHGPHDFFRQLLYAGLLLAHVAIPLMVSTFYFGHGLIQLIFATIDAAIPSTIRAAI